MALRGSFASEECLVIYIGISKIPMKLPHSFWSKLKYKVIWEEKISKILSMLI